MNLQFSIDLPSRELEHQVDTSGNGSDRVYQRLHEEAEQKRISVNSVSGAACLASWVRQRLNLGAIENAQRLSDLAALEEHLSVLGTFRSDLFPELCWKVFFLAITGALMMSMFALCSGPPPSHFCEGWLRANHSAFIRRVFDISDTTLKPLVSLMPASGHN